MQHHPTTDRLAGDRLSRIQFHQEAALELDAARDNLRARPSDRAALERYELARNLAAGALVADAAWILAAARRHLDRERRRAEAPHLAPRELEVLGLVSHGMPNGEIAATMGISIETAKSYIKSLLFKLDARSRAHAVSEGIRCGLIA